MNIIFRVLKIVTIFIFSLGTFAHAEATPPAGESLLQWHFGVTPTLDTAAFNNSAGYNDGSGANGGYPFNPNSLIPTKHMDTADYTISDWFGSWDKDFGFVNISGSYPSGGEWYDVEALYLDNDEDYIYVSVITSAPFKDTNIAGNDANKTIGIVDPRLDSTTAFIRPGDLSINLLKDGTARNERSSTTWNYNYGLDLIDDVRPNNDNSNEYTVGTYYKTQYIRSETLQKGLYSTTSDLPDTASDIVYPSTGDWYTGSRVGHVDAYYELTHFDPATSSSQFSGAYKGDATYVNYYRYTFPSGHEENDAETWVIEAIIPKALFGTDITGQAQQVMAIRWTMGCRNDGANENEGGPFPIIQLKATLDKKDWGDLPDADGVSNSNGANYNTDATGTVGASHVIVNNLYMGSIIDKELEGQPSALADGDDTVDGDDEDGIVFSEFIAGRDAEVNATIFNNSGLDATLYWFIDFNGDGDFLDASESSSVVVSSSNSAQQITLNIPVPLTANIGASLGARFRLSTETTLTANGAAKDGEVEDYLIEVIAKLSIGSLVWEDLNGDGLQDANDVGIEDVNVTLLDENGVALASPSVITTLADGKYYFSGLSEGKYSVLVSPPTGMGYVPCRVQTTVENAIEDDSNIASSNGNGYQSAQFFLQANTEPTEVNGKVGDDADDGADENGDMTVDFCFYKPASLGNYVWYDDNKDGEQEFKEAGVPDVNVTLLKDCNPNTISSTTTTDSEGKYLFSDLDAGDYCVAFSELPSDMMVTIKGTGTETDSDASRVAPYRTEVTTLLVGENDLSWDMGIYSNKASIGDLVWYDLNKNGQQDTLEGGVVNVTVKLYDENCNNELNSTITDSNGKYLFDSLTPATYCLEFTGLEEGYVITTQDSGNNETDSDVNASTGKTVNIVLADGVNDLSWDMGIYKPASLGDYVWNDKNANGLQDGDEVPVAGIDVTLLGSDCATPVVGVDPQTTDVNGSYLFTDLVAGEYCVEFSNISTGYAITPQGKGDDALNSDVNVSSGRTDLITVNAGESIRTIDMGIYEEASIGDLVWNDINANGIQDGREAGKAGVTVTLYGTDCLTIAKDNEGVDIDPVVTDGNGLYKFEQLMPAEYCLGFTLLEGYGFSPQNNGTVSTDSDVNVTTGKTISIELLAGEDDMTWDAGIFEAASIGDKVWYDKNANGLQDANESGVLNVEVILYKSDCSTVAIDGVGTSIPSTHTLSDGSYHFGSLVPNDYCVGFNLATLPTGYKVSPQNIGVDETKDSDANETGVTVSTNLVGGENDTTWDMGIYSPASLGDKVWLDNNANGIQDANESGVADVNVTLYEGDCTTVVNIDNDGVAISAITTGADGSYNFSNLTPAEYCVGFNLPNGYVLTTKNATDDGLDSDVNSNFKTDAMRIESGENNSTLDMGIYKPASIGNVVWYDDNGDGIQDSNESMVQGAEVTLYDGTCNNVVSMDNSGVAITVQTTDANGEYNFTNLTPGSYCVGFDKLPAEYKVTPLDSGSNDALDSDVNAVTKKAIATTLDSGENDVSWDMGIYKPASLGNRVWNDLNADGIQDANESGVENIKVTLYGSDCTTVAIDENGSTIGTIQTDVNGQYLFTNLVPNSYCVGFSDIPSIYTLSPQDSGNDNAKDSDVNPSSVKTEVTTLLSGENDLSWDMGIYEGASIGDKVWYDKNANGIQDAGELGVENVSVNLYEPDCTTAVATVPTAQTNADGQYAFTNLVPDDYCVGFDLSTLPTGYKVSPQKVGRDDAQDSNADSTGKTESTTLLGGENDTSWDMGIYKPASIGNFIWLDEDADGVQDANESGVANVRVTLYKSDCETAVTTDDEGNAIASVLTGANGIYGFSNLTPSSYCVGFESLPFNHVITHMNQGDDLLDSDVNLTSRKTIATVLESGENDQSWDMGVYEPASIGSTVWLDSNADGIQDANETGVKNVTVTLYESDCTTSIGSKTTDANGIYEFKSLTPSEYCIGFTVPNAYLVSPTDVGNDNSDSDVNLDTNKTISTKLSSGEHDLSWDMGIFKPASIGDSVWNDVNANGIQDANESAVQNVSVTLLKGDCTSRATDRVGVDIAPVLTDVNGVYSFNNLQPNDYCVGFTVPNGFVVSPKNSIADVDLDSDVNSDSNTTDATTLSMDENDSSWDMGIYQPVSIGNYVWLDDNRDGTQDANESGIADMNVTLYEADCTTEIKNMVTGSNGEYLFANLVPNAYCLGFDLPNGYAWTAQDSGDDTKDSDVDRTTNKTVSVNLLSGSNDLSWDAGIYKLSSLGDFVWYDDVKNGVQDANETGVADMNVTLYTDCNTSRRAIKNTTTDSNGFYLFSNLEPNDDYCIGFDNLPNGYQFTVDPEHNLSSTLECIVDTSTGITQEINLPYATNDLRWDMGIIPKCLDEEGRHLEIHDDSVVANAVGSVTTIDILANDFGNLDIESIRFVKTIEGEVYHSNGTVVAGTSIETYDTLVVPGEGTWRVTSDGKITFTSETGFSGVPAPVYYIVQCKQGILSKVAQASITSNCICETYEEKAVAAMNNYGMFLMLLLTSTLTILLFRKEFE